ncbi:hypothetical protein Smp_149710 [Schistosoma mansoni]|uniref:hypothetical protein n=1 Tax=Schistosoma mansoni TaxID=6183 RepID=UPI0001A643A7|nr:hypothetical protein Smp_149710 [Schistosoma mansoni]|eukprot:XP_018646156.1 hypothetical protein Smp_149710 [Schistosoma mansoni]
MIIIRSTMPSAEIESSRHLISRPLWIKDPNYFDLQSLTRSDYLWDPRTSRKTEPEGIRARSFKPKVSAYKSTIDWDSGEKEKSISCVHTQLNPNKYQNHSYSLTSLLDQQPRDWLIDDYDSKHKGWRRTDQIVRNKESFTKNSLYREQFPPKEADHVQPVKPVHIPLKTSEKFTDKSIYTDEYIWRPIIIDYSHSKHHKLRLPIEMIPSKPRDESNMISIGENVMSAPGTSPKLFKNTTYREDFQRHALTSKEPVMCRKIAPAIKLSKVLKPPYEIQESYSTINSRYQYDYASSIKHRHLSDRLPAAGITTSGGPIKNQNQTYSFDYENDPLLLKEKSNIQENSIKEFHSNINLSQRMYLPDIIEQVENKWPYLEHKKGCFYTTRPLEGSF